ncbi:MAG: cytochrome c3 family protein [bacterium]
MKNSRLISFVIFVLYFFSLLSFCAAEGEYDEKIVIEEPEAQPKPLFEEVSEPHLGVSCESCHKQRPIPGSTEEELRTWAGTFWFDEISLCESCHKKTSLHPTGVDARKIEKPMSIPDIFPIGKYGSGTGAIICSTCHDLHAGIGNFYLLRGFPKSAFDFEPVFQNRESFCKSCHGDRVASRIPHKGDMSPCEFCHVGSRGDPLGRPTGRFTESPLRQKTENICHFCHNELSPEHYKDVNPYSDLKEDPECVTCHDVHGYSQKGHFVNSGYEELANESKKINPHFKNAFCVTCHTEEPVKGVSNIRFGGNVVDACMRCHKDEFPWRTADFHPVNVSVDIPGRHNPKKLRLFDGKITCLTCHLADCQIENKKEVKKNNKIFLRGGPYQYRSDICFDCHERDAYIKYNVHDQIDSRGIVREGVCLYCHRVQPDRKVKMQKQDSSNFVAPMADLCVRCHRDKFHPGQKDHMKRVSADMQKRKSVYEIEQNVFFPMDGEENVTCVTCHNPHEKGIIPWGAGAKGADEPDKLRLVKKDGLLCQVCHTGRGLK